MSRLAVFALVLALVLGLGAACARPATAISLGGCGRAEGATDLAAQSETGRLVTAGPLGAAVYDDETLSGPDRTRISGGIRALLFASDDGARLAVWDAGSLRVFDFRTLERLGKVRVKGLGGQTAMAARWPAQGEEVVIVGHRERRGFFGLGASREPRIARLDVTTGRSVFLPLALEGELISAAVDAAGRRVALALAGGRVEVRSALDGRLEAGFAAHDGTPWNSMGLAFHPRREVLATSPGGFTLLYDLESHSVTRKLAGVSGGRFLRFLAGGRFLLAGDTTRMSFHDEAGRKLHGARPPEWTDYSPGSSFDWIAVAEGARRVYTLGGYMVCWWTFPGWKAPN